MQSLTASTHEAATAWIFNKLLTYRGEGEADAEPSFLSRYYLSR